MKSVIAVCWDAGPANNVGPVVRQLREMGIPVSLFAGGPAEKALQDQGVEYKPYTRAKDLVTFYRESAVLYAAIDCNDRMPGAEIAQELEDRGIDWPILLQNDTWGGGLYRNEEWRKIKPVRFFGNDRRDVELAKIAFPLMDSADALAIGWPWLDAYSDQSQIEARRVSIRRELSIPDGIPVVLYAGQLSRSGEVWESLVRSIIALDTPVFLIARLHPRMLPENDLSQDWHKEFERFETALSEYTRWGKGLYALCNNPFDPKDLIAGADVVTGMFTTMLLEASVWQKQVIAILYPEVGMAEYHRVTIEQMSEFPLTELGCAAKAATDGELESLLREAYSGELGKKLRPNQVEHFGSDGRNAQKIAEEIKTFL